MRTIHPLRRPSLRRVALLAGLLSLLMVTITQAASFKLSGSMPAFGDVGTVRVSPDGQYAVYRADYDTDEINNIFSVPLAGGTRVPLSSAVLAGTNGDAFAISADSTRVVFTSDQETDDLRQLYSVPITGPAASAIKLSLALPANGGVVAFKLTPDGTHVLYLADAEADSRFELYRVPIAGPASATQKLSLPIAGTTTITDFAITSDSSRVVYVTRACTISNCSSVIELYSVPIAGPPNAAIKIKEQLGGDVFSNFQFLLSPDNTHVVYIDDQDLPSTFELYSVPITGPLAATVKLNGPLASDQDVQDFTGGVQISPDSRHVLYLADQDTSSVTELYSVPIAGPAAAGVKLNKPLVVNGTLFQFTVAQGPAGALAVYNADQDTDNVLELYSVPAAGPSSAGVKLNKPLVAGGNTSTFKIMADGSRVIYSADQDTDNLNELYSVPAAGPASAGVKLNKPLPVGGQVSGFEIAPDSSQVAYRAQQDSPTVTELYSVPPVGPAANGSKISGPMNTNGNANSILIAPDGGRVLYTADQQTDGVFELYISDAGPPLVSFDSATLTVTETGGTANLGVSLARSTILPVNIQYRVSGGSASNGSDYTLAAGTLSFLPGQKSANIPLTLLGDTLLEGDETVQVVIESPTNALLGATVEQTVVINDGQVALPLVVR